MTNYLEVFYFLRTTASYLEKQNTLYRSMIYLSMKQSILFVTLSAFLCSCSKEGGEIYNYSLQLDKTECVASKEGGEFTFHVSDYSGELSLFWYFEEDTSETQYIYRSATNDTLQTNWYQAVVTGGEEPVIQVKVFQNDSYCDRKDVIWVQGGYQSTNIDIKQAAF